MKIIIKNHTNLSFSAISDIINRTIKLGRISNNGKQYCFLTKFVYDNEVYWLKTELRKCSDVFIITKENEI